MRKSGAVQQLSEGDVEAALKEGGGEEGGMERDKEEEEEEGGLFWDPSASGEGNVLWSKGGNVKAVMWVNVGYFRGPDGNIGDERWH